jgi:hypothetical protein
MGLIARLALPIAGESKVDAEDAFGLEGVAIMVLVLLSVGDVRPFVFPEVIPGRSNDDRGRFAEAIGDCGLV